MAGGAAAAYLQAACSGGVAAWTGSDRGTRLPPRCSESGRGEFSPVMLTPAQLQKRKSDSDDYTNDATAIRKLMESWEPAAFG